MYMAGYEDEDAFDDFRQSLTWEGYAEKIRCPYLCLAGEADELSPLEHTERLLSALDVPKQYVVYAEARHSMGGGSSVMLGPSPRSLAAEWMLDRLNGKPFPSERWHVDSAGRVTRTPF
jgi:fermentation-respiration switch protein FrsA (DUF1100 family)